MTHDPSPAPAPPYVRLPPLDLYDGDDPCPICGGARTAPDEGYTLDTDDDQGTVLFVDVFCPTCDGCGSAGHDDCKPLDHAHVDPDDLDGETLRAWRETRCASCHDRRWWPSDGILGAGEVDVELRTLRMPCGCAAPLLQPV